MQALGDGQLLLLGLGHMGQSLLAGWRQKGLADAQLLIVTPRLREAAAGLVADAAQVADITLAPVTPVPRVVLLAVKPQKLAQLLPLVPEAWRQESLFITVAAGKALAFYEQWLGEARLIRAMPNTPVAVGSGMTTLVASASATAADRALAQTLLGAVGATLWLDSEAQMSAATALAGCGPAYLFYLLEVLAEIGTRQGLPATQALMLAQETLLGAAKLAIESGQPPAALRQGVASPGGVTAAALEVLMQEDRGLEPLFEEALAAAIARDQSL